MGQEEGQLLLRRVVLLQACLRGYLTRKRLRMGVTEEYERIVKEIEGDLDGLRWIQASVPRPVFLREPAQKSLKQKELNGQEPGSKGSKSQEKEQLLDQEVLFSEKEGDVKVQLLARLSERPFPEMQEIPQTMPDLQRHRKNLAMELLWLQQAIVSRKNYLILKQRVGSPQ